MLLFGGCIRGSADKVDQALATAEQTAAGKLPSDAKLQALLDESLNACLARKMTTQDNAAWQIVHGILAYGPNLQINAGGQSVSALHYLLDGGQVTGWNFRKGDKGLVALIEEGKIGQGHDDQWLGYLSQIGMPPEQTIKIVEGGQTTTYTLKDLIEQAKWDLHPGQEATWTLMALSTYLPLDAQWTSRTGDEWTLEKIAELEAGENLIESSCGGTHRLYGLAAALNRYRNETGKSPEELTGGWKKAHDVIRQSVATFHSHQQPDGSFSARFLERPAATPDVALRLNCTGHTLEFLTLALTDAELAEPWMVNATERLAKLILQTQDMPVECGGLYHAAHGLYLYHLRRFGEWKPAPPSTSAAARAEGETGSAEKSAGNSEAADGNDPSGSSTENPATEHPATVPGVIEPPATENATPATNSGAEE